MHCSRSNVNEQSRRAKQAGEGPGTTCSCREIRLLREPACRLDILNTVKLTLFQETEVDK